MSNHTAGPWTVDDDGIIEAPVLAAVIAEVYLADAFPCLEVGDEQYEATAAECEANARLIAAAPELLAACEQALDVLGIPEPYSQHRPVINQVRAAIAKARKKVSDE